MKYIKLIDKEFDVCYQYSVSEDLFNRVRDMAEKELKEIQEQEDEDEI